MQFKIQEKLKPAPLLYAWRGVDGKIINAIADVLTDEEYHEICHQLHGTKSEYNGLDDGLYHNSDDLLTGKRHAVRDSLYRGVFAATMNELELLKEQEEDEKYYG